MLRRRGPNPPGPVGGVGAGNPPGLVGGVGRGPNPPGPVGGVGRGESAWAGGRGWRWTIPRAWWAGWAVVRIRPARSAGWADAATASGCCANRHGKRGGARHHCAGAGRRREQGLSQPGRQLPQQLARFYRPGCGQHRRRSAAGHADRRLGLHHGAQHQLRRQIALGQRLLRFARGAGGAALQPGGEPGGDARDGGLADRGRLPVDQARAHPGYLGYRLGAAHRDVGHAAAHADHSAAAGGVLGRAAVDPRPRFRHVLTRGAADAAHAQSGRHA